VKVWVFGQHRFTIALHDAEERVCGHRVAECDRAWQHARSSDSAWERHIGRAVELSFSQ